MKNFEKIQMLLLPTAKSAVDDSVSFHAWERGEISTASCIRRFRDHNMVRKDVDISQVDFELWLNSLGYIRGIYQWQDQE